MPQTTKFTLCENTKGLLSKKVSLDSAGKLSKSPAAAMYQGKFKTVELNWEAEFGDFISNLTTNQAICHGICCRLDSEHQPLSEGRLVKNNAIWNPKNGVISRTQENFAFHGTGVRNGGDNFSPYECSTPNLTMLDLDGIEPGATVEELVTEALMDLPILQSLGCWAYPSAGSYIYKGDEQITGLTGLHIYLLIPQEILIKDFCTYVDVTLWNSGKGFIFISKSGQRIKRVPIDLSVFTPERLDFIAGAICEDGLTQRRPEPLYFPPISDAGLPKKLFTPFDVESAEERKAAAYRGAKFSAEKIKGKFTTTLAHKANLGTSDAENLVKLIHKGQLGGSHPIHLDDGGQVPAWRIALHPQDYNKKTCADPVEPEYGGEGNTDGVNKAICYTEGMDKASIFSHAHGGQTWKIVIDFISAKAILELYGEDELMELLGSEWISFLSGDNLTQGDRERLFEVIKKKQMVSKDLIKSMFDSAATTTGNSHLDKRLRELNEQFAIITNKGKVRVVSETFDPDMKAHVINLLTKNDFQLLLDNQVYFIWSNGKRKKSKLSQAWLEWEERAEFKGFSFDTAHPGDSDEFMNLFKGFAVPPRDIGYRKCKGRFCDKKGCLQWFLSKGHKSCEYGSDEWTDQWGCWVGVGKQSDVEVGVANVQFWVRHIYEVFAHGDMAMFIWILDWIADILQNPGENRPGTALAVQGSKGCGKGAVFNTISKLVGQHSYHTSNMREMTGNFNAHLQRVIFLFADESLWSGDKNAEGTLKKLITEDTLNITFKGFDSFATKNRLRIGIASNEHWIVPATIDERRFCVCKAWSGRRVDEDWFKRVLKPSLEDLLSELLAHKITSKLRSAPMTEALAEQVIQSQDIVEEFYSRLPETKPDWFVGVPIPTSDVWDEFVETYRAVHGFSFYTPSKFGRRMASFNKADIRKHIRVNKRTVRCVTFAKREVEHY